MNTQTIIQSTKWSAITEILSRCLSPLINIFLARILTPEIFGVIAALTIVTSLAETFTDAGFQKYLVQHEFIDAEDRRKSTDVAFWTNFCFSCFVWIGIFLFRDILSVLIGCPGYGIELCVLSIMIPMTSMYSIQNALFQRDFRFRDLLPIRLTGCLVPLFITIPLALLWRNCWALIVGMLCKELISIVFLTIKSVWKPSLYFDFYRLKEMLSFSLLILADSLVVWFCGYAGTVIISKQLDLYHLGVFRIGQGTADQYLSVLSAIVMPVFFASLSRTQCNKNEYDRIYYQFQKYYAYIFIPLGIGMLLYSDFLVWILLGNQWYDAIWIFGLWSFVSSFVILTAHLNSYYYRAIGRPGLALVVQSIYCIVLLIVYWITVKLPFHDFCTYAIFSKIFYAVVSTVAIVIIFKVSIFEMLLNLIKPTVAATIMGLFALVTRPLYSGVIWTIMTILMCIVVYFGVMSISSDCREDFRRIYGMILKRG